MKGFAVAQNTDLFDAMDGGSLSVLRIGAAYPTCLQNARAPLAGYDVRATQTLQLRYPTRMIEMNVRIHDQLHIFNAKTQRLNIGDDLLCRFRECSVHQHMSGIRGDQNRA